MSSVTVVQCQIIPEKATLLQSSRSGSASRDIILLSKHSTLSTQSKQASKQEAAVMDTARKKPKAKESVSTNLVSIRTTPPPAVARRNARERNRVKQVNNGFANLRQHIPNSIAAAFESGRSGSKKLSKVDTLRMAVEYIRSLEELLSDASPSANECDSMALTYSSSTPLMGLESQSGTNYSSSIASPSSEDDDFSGNSTPPPLQYIKVSGPDSYHLLPMHVIENSERLKSLKIKNDLVSSSAVVKFQNEQMCGSGAPRSPGIYSESSLSPGAESDIPAFIPVFNMNELSSSPPTIKVEEVSESTNEEMRILCHNLIMLQADGHGDLGKQLNMNELITW